MRCNRHGQPDVAEPCQRQRWMAVVAKAEYREVEQAWAALPVQPLYDYLRAPEVGLAQIRGRIGGTGQAFNLGEVTVSRCTVQLASGEMGVGYVAGRNLRHAELAAVLDAMLQRPAFHDLIQAKVIDVLAAAYGQRKRREAEAVAATRVHFFTMLRGDG